MHLELLSISAAAPSAAYDPSIRAEPPAAAAAAAAAAPAAAAAVSQRPPAPYGTCTAAVQPQLRYNVSSLTLSLTLPLALTPTLR